MITFNHYKISSFTVMVTHSQKNRSVTMCNGEVGNFVMVRKSLLQFYISNNLRRL